MTGVLPRAVLGLCDDAAVFPPGLASLPDAVVAHRGYERSWFSGLTGPLVIAAPALAHLGPLLHGGDRPLPVSVTLPGGPGPLREVLAAASRIDIELRSVEVAVPEAVSVEGILDELGSALDGAAGIEVYVEVPRDARRTELVGALSGRYRAKFRTGGVRAELYPDEAELAAAVRATVGSSTSPRPFWKEPHHEHCRRPGRLRVRAGQPALRRLLRRQGHPACGRPAR